MKSNTTAVVDYEHHQPVSFGLSVRKSLPKGFSVETGLTYTLLSSDIKRQGDTKMQSQKLHYIGIPVRGNWNFLEKKYFTLYVSAGGMVEKCVYGKLADDKVNVKPLQFSVGHFLQTVCPVPRVLQHDLFFEFLPIALIRQFVEQCIEPGEIGYFLCHIILSLFSPPKG